MMKKILFFLFITLLTSHAWAQGYRITLKVPSFKSGIAYLTYYMGDNLNVADSTAISNTGIAIFKGATKLPPGIYVIVLPGKRLRNEFLISKEQQINISIPDTLDMVNKTIITGSKENIPYMAYQKFVAAKGKLLMQEKSAYMRSRSRIDSIMHENNYNTYNKQLSDYRQNIIKTQPESMLAALLNAMREPTSLPGMAITHQDSLTQFYYFKSHYWDGISFMDERIVRTPFFPKKLDRYYREIMPPEPDSIIRDIDYKLLLARTAPEMYKYLLNWLTDEFMYPKYMGQDAVFVHLFEKYHSKGLTPWLNKQQMESINRRAYMLMANLIGEKGTNLEMVDSMNSPSALYDVNAAYTILTFWDPHCGHCKEEIPRIDSIYRASWKSHNVKIYAVLTQDEKEDLKHDWINYIKEHQLGDWVHVYQTREMEAAERKSQQAGFRQLYDVTMTPTLYLLDKDKHIIGKKLTWEQLNDLLEVKWKTSPSN